VLDLSFSAVAGTALRTCLALLVQMSLAFAGVAGVPGNPLANLVIHLRRKIYQAALEDLDAYIRLDPDSADDQTAKHIRADTQRKLENPLP